MDQPVTKRVRVNPCQAKGRYAGFKSGRHYRRGKRSVTVAGCECGQPFLLMGEERTEQRVCLAMRFGRDAISVVTAPDGKPAAVTDLVVAPCGETFRYRDSPGTKLFRAQTKVPSKFQGCQTLEEDLVREGLVRHELTESFGKKRDSLLGAKDTEPFRIHLDDEFPDLLAEQQAPRSSDDDKTLALFLEELEKRDAVRQRRLANIKTVRAWLASGAPGVHYTTGF